MQKVSTGLREWKQAKRAAVPLEVGTHSPWVTRLLKSFGQEVIVANARQVKLITQSSRKNDKLNANFGAAGASGSPAVKTDPAPPTGFQPRTRFLVRHSLVCATSQDVGSCALPAVKLVGK